MPQLASRADPTQAFHPLVADWFSHRFTAATEVQTRAWAAVRDGGDVLVTAPTGSGKTLAAFLVCIDRLVREAQNGVLRDETRVLYVSPLKALGYDIQQNLDRPLREIASLGRERGMVPPALRTAVRTGDTPPSERERAVLHPPHILVTTPESLFILLTAGRSRAALARVETVILDEIHAVVGNKRGSHLALSLARLDDLVEKAGGRAPQRIGLSATVSPVDVVAGFLSPDARPLANGSDRAASARSRTLDSAAAVPGEDAPGAGRERTLEVVDSGHQRPLDVAVEVPRDELGAVASKEMWSEIYDRLAGHVRAHRTTLVFVNTRRLAERVAHHLGERVGERLVLAHHGSLSRRVRAAAEDRLRRGDVRAIVATASLELGIDIGTVDLVCQIGSPRSIAVALQRIGRSGHHVDPSSVPKGRIFATTRDELIESAALVRAIRSGALDATGVPEWPRDVLAQQVVAAAAAEPWREEDLFRLVRRAAPYRELPRHEFDAVVDMLSEGIATARGRGAGAFLHRDRVNGVVRGRRGARLAALTSGGAIPENASYFVVADPDETIVGTVDEDFAVESMAGDVFLLGTTSWRIRRVEPGRVRVEDAHGAPPSVPFWRGEAPGRTPELSAEVARIREEIVSAQSELVARAFLQRECGLDRLGAEQAVEYVRAGAAALGAVPTDRTVIAERFFDEAGGMQLVIHAPFGARINRAWGLALRKRFCRSFNLELQAAATDDGIVISLAEQHSFPLDAVFRFLAVETVEEVLTQAMLAAPLFAARWRWNATRSLAVLRSAGGRKVPAPIQRMRGEDLLAAVFPDQAACPENLEGDIRIPDHPLVAETIRDALHEAMDLDGLKRVLGGIRRGDIRTVAIDTPQPSVFSHEILNANPYAFLDDAPLEERRARAVRMRHALPAGAGDIGALDPAAIEDVAAQAWPPVRDVEELHDALLTLVVLPQETAVRKGIEGRLLDDLVGLGRAARVADSGRTFWVAAERVGSARAAYPSGRLEPGVRALDAGERDREAAVTEIVRGWLESTGPATVFQLAALLGLDREAVEAAVARLESEGQVLRGRFSASGGEEVEWCNRRLLARIHRLTVGRLRREIEPVTPAVFLRFLCRWQHVASGTQLHGLEGTLRVLVQLQGYEVMAGGWEADVLSRRVARYSPDLLDHLCLCGDVMWGRLSPPHLGEGGDGGAGNAPGPNGTGRRPRPTRAAPVAIFTRTDAAWLIGQPPPMTCVLSGAAKDVLNVLRGRGASFLAELAAFAARPVSDVEGALWELSAAGMVTADGFGNLRALLDPKHAAGQRPGRLRQSRLAAGRWAVLPGRGDVAPAVAAAVPETASPADRAEPFARQLLLRWGVVFRDVLARETIAPPWRDLLAALRRMEARGEIRGGRFVNGFTGEQFALPEAVDALRAVRHLDEASQPMRVAAADPLNLAGILTPGPRISPLSRQNVDLLAGS